MNDNTIEIRDDEINVEEIMDKIRENIRRRQTAGELPPDSDILNSPLSCSYTDPKSDDSFQRDFTYISSNWDIHNNSYTISSHRPYIGKVLVKGRQLVHGEIRRYIDPVISWQTEFNACIVRILTRVSNEQTEFDRRIAQKIDIAIREIESKIDSQQQNNQQQLERIAHVLEGRITKGQTQTHFDQKLRPAGTEINYFLFEERFRGTREEIKQRQEEFLPYFENSSRVLDIGCGRGEFLEILKEHDISGVGIDLDPDMVDFCVSHNLNVEQEDGITYLEKCEDNSLDGIFIDQVVEHLEPDYLVRLLALCFQKLKQGYYLIIETVNPLSFVSFVNFYIDMTHTRPVHPETLHYLLNASGFRECERKYLSPVSDDIRLRKIANIPTLDEAGQKNLEIYNDNIEMLNSVLFGAQDYAVIAKR
jgi:SAM-dependent methyltransferase